MQVTSGKQVSFLRQAVDVQHVIFGKNISEMGRDIPELLKQIRLAKGFSQLGIAETVGISLSTYGRYERGEADIAFDTVVKLAEHYRMSLDEFYHFGEPKYVVSEPQAEYNTMKKELENLREQLSLTNKLLDSKDRLLDQFRKDSAKGVTS